MRSPSRWWTDLPRDSTLLRALDKDDRIAGHYPARCGARALHERAGDRERRVGTTGPRPTATSNTPERNYLLMKASRIRDGHTENTE